MNYKIILYLIFTPIVMWALESLNLNFKRNKILQARILYLIIGFCMSYLLVNFVSDFYSVSKIIG